MIQEQHQHIASDRACIHPISSLYAKLMFILVCFLATHEAGISHKHIRMNYQTMLLKHLPVHQAKPFNGDANVGTIFLSVAN